MSLAIPVRVTSAPSYDLFLCYSYGYSYGVAPAPQLQFIRIDIPMGLSQPPNYDLCVLLFLWGCPCFSVTTYPYVSSYGIAPVPQLTSISMAILMRLPQPPISYLFLWLLL
jgi:hypothetical protein